MRSSVLELSPLVSLMDSDFLQQPGNAYHRPVMVEEVVRLMGAAPGRLIVDGTVGGGGHTEALLAAGADVIGLDRDAEAIATAGVRLAAAGGRLRLVRANFRALGEVLDGIGVDKVDGVLLDIGVSSHQLDTPERGFSFQQDGPLDMRMDPRDARSAAELVNTAPVEELKRIFRFYGEEPAAGRAAAAIAHARQQAAIETTLALASVIESAIPRRSARHPATRVFQALRLAVNDELAALSYALEAAPERLRVGGRLGVMTFHSLEDRIVKHFFRDTTAESLDRPEWPRPRPNPRHWFRLVTRHPICADEAEQRANPRSRSAKFRVVERLEVPAS